tara:strand:- start:660 stop:1196 length:537 start_codon:yes stop_codon:yes gene_type:complete
MANQVSDAERYQLREKLMKGINPPLQDPVFKEVAEAQRWNPEAMTQERLAEFQKIGWFKGYEYNPEVYEQHKKELAEAEGRTYPDPEPTPEQIAKDIERKKMITQVVGAEWKFEDESLDDYKERTYGIPNPIRAVTPTPQHKAGSGTEDRKRLSNRTRDKASGAASFSKPRRRTSQTG